jgi:REP element-mobilizing transposase RayT
MRAHATCFLLERSGVSRDFFTEGAKAPPMRYLITFSCYGAHLHGQASGSVDRDHNVYGNPIAEPSARRVAFESELMDQPPYLLNTVHRTTVLDALHQGCLRRGWSLWAAHVRTTHVHAVVESEDRPEMVMNALKSYASRSLNLLEAERKRWTRHGSTRWLWKDEDVQEAIRYVVLGQGEAMEVYLRE